MPLNTSFIADLMMDPQVRAALNNSPDPYDMPDAPMPGPRPGFMGPQQDVMDTDAGRMASEPSMAPPPGPGDVMNTDIGRMAAMPSTPPPPGPTLLRPREIAPPMAPPGYGGPQYAQSQALFPEAMPRPNLPGSPAFMPPQRQARGWKESLAQLIGGGLAGATTPSANGGGAVDIFRGMQAGQGYGHQRDINAYQMRRQQGIDQQNADLHRAQMEDYRAQAEERRARANDPEAILGKAYADAVMRGDTAAAKEAYDKITTLKHGPQKPEKPEKPETPWKALTGGLGTYNDQTGEVRINADPVAKARVAALRSLRGVPASTTDAEMLKTPMTPTEDAIIFGKVQPTPHQAAPHYSTDGQGRVHIIDQDGKGGILDTIVPGAGKPSPPHDKSAAELKREDQKEASKQAYLIWQGTQDWLAKNGQPTDILTIEKTAKANAMNPQYFPDLAPIAGYIGQELTKIAGQGGLNQKRLTPTGGFGSKVEERTRNGAPTPTPTPGGRGSNAGHPAGGQVKPEPKPATWQDVMATYEQFKTKRGWKNPDEAKRYMESVGYTVK